MLLSILLGVNWQFWIISLLLFVVVTNDENINKIKIKKLIIPKTAMLFIVETCVALVGMFIVDVCGISVGQQQQMLYAFDLELAPIAFSFLALSIFTFVFQLIGIVLRRYIDGKTLFLKVFSALSYINLVVDGASALFVTFMFLGFIANIISIYYNRDEKIKLLNENN